MVDAPEIDAMVDAPEIDGEVVNTTIATSSIPAMLFRRTLHSPSACSGISGRRCVRSIDGNCGRQSNIIFDQCFVRPVDPGITSVRICPSTRANRGGSFEVSMVTSSTQCPRSSRSRRLHIPRPNTRERPACRARRRIEDGDKRVSAPALCSSPNRRRCVAPIGTSAARSVHALAPSSSADYRGATLASRWRPSHSQSLSDPPSL